ncbi:hypothetical protein TNCV_412091 [Trichonephila clavipes]|uniref:Uncharacterized protein n=1 Tax=Trichonephila clavipes TaxID=2585209 RepID=A0A8X6VGG6_TRICX|nr:hypothetical protein TNCV_412091 [Trichonephila clavipes]
MNWLKLETVQTSSSKSVVISSVLLLDWFHGIVEFDADSGVLGFKVSKLFEIEDLDLQEKLDLTDSDSISDYVQSLTQSRRILLSKDHQAYEIDLVFPI